MLKQMISRSTRKNWERLQSGTELRLARRANKRLSTKKIVPLEYFCRRDNTQAVEKLLLLLNEPQAGITDLLCSVAEKLFRRAGIWQCRHVREVLSHYPYHRIPGVDDCPLPEGEKWTFNDSVIHIDFMIGTSDLHIVGTAEDGQEIVVFDQGDFVL